MLRDKKTVEQGKFSGKYAILVCSNCWNRKGTKLEYHRLGRLNNKHLFLTVLALEVWGPGQAESSLGEGSFPSLQLSSQYILTWHLVHKKCLNNVN